MANEIVTVYHLLLQYPALLYSTFTLREMKLAIQFSCDGKKRHFMQSIRGKNKCSIH